VTAPKHPDDLLKRGVPTKYDPSFCERVIEMGKQGFSKVEMSCELDISRASFDNYEKQHPEFLEAVTRALEFSQSWWLKGGKKGTFGEIDGFNSNAYNLQMKNRFKEDWAERTVVDNNVTHTLTDYK